MRWGLRARLAFWHGVGVAVVLAITFIAADLVLWRSIGSQVDAALVTLAETEAASALDSATVHLHQVRRHGDRPMLATLDKLVQVLDADGRVIDRSANLQSATLPVAPDLLARVRNREIVLETIRDFAGGEVRLVSLPVEEAGQVRYVFQVGTPLAPARAFLHTTRIVRIGLVVAILAVVALIGVGLARSALRPIEAMTAMAQRIGESSLQERLPHPGTRDEIGHLVDTLNGMLERLERSFSVQSRFTADAAHELRSPLSRLRGELEVALRRPREEAEYRDVLRSCLDEVERLSRLTDDLLTLARLDAGERQGSERTPVRVGPIIDRAVARLEADARRKNVTIVEPAPPALAVSAFDGSLDRVIGNLLENAVKFTPPGGQVRIDAGGDEAGVVITVADTGPGIPPEELPRVFERFYRGDSSRPSEAGGVGLGLAICRGIVEAQGGSITIGSTPGGGTTVTVRLPQVPAPQGSES